MMPLKFFMLLPTVILFLAVAFKLASAIMDFAVTDLTSIYYGLVSWFTPPYLYLIINGIIATIFACSKLQSTKYEESHPKKDAGTLRNADADATPLSVVMPAERSTRMDYQEPSFKYNDINPNAYDVSFMTGPEIQSYEQLNGSVCIKSEAAPFHLISGEGADAISKKNECVVSESTWKSHRNKEMTEYAHTNVKPLVSARFGHQRNLKYSTEGGKMMLGVSKPKRQGTLEATWKTITEGRAMPLTRHLKKLDTWECHGGPVTKDSHPLEKVPLKTMAKSDTFSSPPGGSIGGSSGRLKRESSLSQDELNRRVETFIRKFNEEMRLQRQESLIKQLEIAKRADLTSAS